MKALLIFSGGQDSTTCLGWSLNKGYDIEAINFNYGQKHLVEVKQAEIICDLYKIKLHKINISFLDKLVDSALTSNGDVTKQHDRLTHLPASFVPNRNALFITLAHALAQKIGASKLITGVCETDYSGYPDCRASFIKSIENTLNIGSDSDIEIETPLMYLNKAEVWKIALSVNFLNVIKEHTHTCYNGDHETKHIWGYGCDNCPACELRKKGWYEFERSLNG